MYSLRAAARRFVLFGVLLMLPLNALAALNAPTVTVGTSNLPTYVSGDPHLGSKTLGTTASAVLITFSEPIIVAPAIKDGRFLGAAFEEGSDAAITDCNDTDAATFCFDYSTPANQDSVFRYFRITGAQNSLGDTIPETYYEFIADTVGAAITITSSDISHSSRPTITGTGIVTGSAPIGVLISGTGGSYYTTTFTSGLNWSITVPTGHELPVGTYTVTASSTDAAGNVGNATPQTLTLDNEPPAISITSGPPNNSYISTTTISFDFLVTDTDSFTVTCSFDSGDFNPCTSPATPNILLPEGTGHTFDLRAVDSFGNTSNTRIIFSIDLTAPTITITSTSSASNLPTLTGTTTSDVVGVTLSLNNKTYTVTPAAGVWSAPVPFGDQLADSTYTIVATSTDAAGNVGTTSASLLVDTTAPTVSIDTGPTEGGYATSSPSFAFSVSDAHLATTECAWDGVATSTCLSPATPPSLLGDGSHRFTVLGTDTLANSASSSRTFVVDTTAPVLTESAAIATSTNTTPDYTFSSTEAATLTYSGSCSSATASATASSNTVTFAALAVGTYSACTITPTDAAGNVGIALAVSPFEISAPPTPTPAPSSGGGGVGNGMPSQNIPQNNFLGLVLGSQTQKEEPAPAVEPSTPVPPPAKKTPVAVVEYPVISQPEPAAPEPEPWQKLTTTPTPLAAAAIGAEQGSNPIVPLTIGLVLLVSLGALARRWI